MGLKVIEVYDGRLPEYQVIEGDNVIKTFETRDQAELWILEKENTPCGEEGP